MSKSSVECPGCGTMIIATPVTIQQLQDAKQRIIDLESFITRTGKQYDMPHCWKIESSRLLEDF